MGNVAYEQDVIRWSREQAQLLRAGQWSQLDIEHIADEIEDVGKSESREIASRMAVLLAHLLKWVLQPERRSRSWESTIKTQRKLIRRRVKRMPSLKGELADPEWHDEAWGDAVPLLNKETGLDFVPASWFWSMEQVLDDEFWPDRLPD
jgi:Domain of unknown function DUF29